MQDLFNGQYQGKTVLVTGNTGFKGAWLGQWLSELGARVIGYALEPPTDPSMFQLLAPGYRTEIADIRDLQRLSAVIAEVQPDIVFHMAAQPIVRLSYEIPVETMEINVMGSVNVLEACRGSDSVKAVVVITSDKCYENREWVWGYRECDPVGGYDPYSASKGITEIATSSYRNSFFHPEKYGQSHRTLVASVRAGNVIGGGDWGQDRLVPDIMKAAARNDTVIIRNPFATRPWQHVLEPLSGYLLVGSRLLEGNPGCAAAWNFGPGDDEALCVKDVADAMQPHWDKITYEVRQDPSAVHEAHYLKLDTSKAYLELKWRPAWSYRRAFEKTVLWYRDYYENPQRSMQEHTLQDIDDYVAAAREGGIAWSGGGR
ncbi:CDP-glucose 4,6-dehydratase [Thermodesulfobacteriota bacterium]